MAVVVTGARGGIGGAVVTEAVRRGHEVVALSRDGVPQASGIRSVSTDLSDPAVLPDLGLDRVDALIHCAGIAEVASVQETTASLWQETFNVNVIAAAELTRRLLPALRRAAGCVVFVNAAAGVHSVPNWSAYAASKAALTELAGSLRREEACHGVRVITLFPDGTATELLRRVREGHGQPYAAEDCLSPETVAGVILDVAEMRGDGYLAEVTLVRNPKRGDKT